MKNHKLLFVLAGCLWASGLLAQTADDYVQMGLTNLTAHNTAGLVAACSNFNAAVTSSPTSALASSLVGDEVTAALKFEQAATKPAVLCAVRLVSPIWT